MIYLQHFSIPSREEEFDFFNLQKSRAYNSYYPFQVLSDRGLYEIDFEPITIFYGGNGSGKTTLLNIIAEKLGARRSALYNRSTFFSDYLRLCREERGPLMPQSCEIVTSDDVFDYMLDLRSLNEGIDNKRREMFEDYFEYKYNHVSFQSLEDYDKLKKANQARSKTQSRFVRDNLGMNVREHSNGENAFRYFTERIQDNGLYLLDEPENSLSPAKQKELADFLFDSARYFSCQMIISTHSPFLLSLKGARVYNLDKIPAGPEKWTNLPNVRELYRFFKEHEGEFEGHGEEM